MRNARSLDTRIVGEGTDAVTYRYVQLSIRSQDHAGGQKEKSTGEIALHLQGSHPVNHNHGFGSVTRQDSGLFFLESWLLLRPALMYRPAIKRRGNREMLGWKRIVV
jgi:hypothetical protein